MDLQRITEYPTGMLTVPKRSAWDWYNIHAKAFDSEMEQSWNGDLDNLLIVVSF